MKNQIDKATPRPWVVSEINNGNDLQIDSEKLHICNHLFFIFLTFLLPMQSKLNKKLIRFHLISRLKAKVEAKDANRVKAFSTGMQTWAKNVLSNFDEYRFYLSENMSPEGMVILQGYREDQTTPYFIFFKDGLEEEKF